MSWLQNGLEQDDILKALVLILCKDVIICSVLWIKKRISPVVAEWAEVWAWCLLLSRDNRAHLVSSITLDHQSSKFLLPCFIQTVCSGNSCFVWMKVSQVLFKTIYSLAGKARELKKNGDMNCYTIDISPRAHFSDPPSFLSQYWNVFICRLVQPGHNLLQYINIFCDNS